MTKEVDNTWKKVDQARENEEKLKKEIQVMKDEYNEIN